MMTDLDMLGPKDRIAEAIEALAQIEYPIHKDPNINWDTHYHAPPMVRPGEYGVIELHRNAFGKNADQVLSTAEIWAKAEECITKGIRFKVPNATHTVLLGILNSQFTHGYLQRFRI
jgi:hypothetical protein